MTRQTIAANGRPWHETISETEWHRLTSAEQERRAYDRTGCTVAYPTWDAPVDCVHSCCHWETLRRAGRERVAARLQANAEARDWLSNWGRLVYDPERHGDNPERRQMAARIVRAMRRQGIGYADACVTGAWAGALLH